MLLNLAKTLKSSLVMDNLDPELSLSLMFFDGEEAMVSWSSVDLTYGSR